MIPILHYGLHFSGDLFFLHEAKETRCLTPGLPALETSFLLERSDRLRCPHFIPPAPAGAMPPDGLLRKLAPIPDGGAYWVPLEARDTIMARQHLCCATRQNVFVPWAHPVQKLAPELMISNLSPLIILAYEARDIAPISQLLSLPRVRTLILCGPYRLASTTPIDFTDPGDEFSGPEILQTYVTEKVREARCPTGN